MPTLGSTLRQLREKSGLQQIEIAQKLGVSRVTVSNWERDVTAPSEENLEGLTELFGVSKSSLRYPNAAGDFSASHQGDLDYTPNPVYAQRVPGAAYRAALGYMRRLSEIGLPSERIDRYERLLLDDRWVIRRRDRNENPTDEEWVDRVEEIWQIIREALATQGVHP